MHFAHQVCKYLNVHYPNRWLGRNGPFIWLAQLPNLNVFDYFAYNFIKNLVEYQSFNIITLEMAYRTTRNIIRRAEFCLREEGTSNNYYIKI
ncbi:hypothetical protein ACFW04_014501 [Cataglyphis niger]